MKGDAKSTLSCRLPVPPKNIKKEYLYYELFRRKYPNDIHPLLPTITIEVLRVEQDIFETATVAVYLDFPPDMYDNWIQSKLENGYAYDKIDDSAFK
jgi:hypothetical protein